MSSTVLEIGNAAADIAGLPQQITLVGNQNQNARKILKAVKDGAKKDASRDFDWARMTQEHTFTTDASSSYSLPTYFDRIVNGTLWDRTNYRPVIGPMTATEWQKHESGLVSLSGFHKLLRLEADANGDLQIKIWPTTDTGSEIAFEYVTTRHVKASGGDLQTEVLADSDTFLIDDSVLEAAAAWRLLRMLGLNYDDEKAEYYRLLSERGANDSGAPVLDMRLDMVFNGQDPGVPDTGYGT